MSIKDNKKTVRYSRITRDSSRKQTRRYSTDSSRSLYSRYFNVPRTDTPTTNKDALKNDKAKIPSERYYSRRDLRIKIIGHVRESD